MENPTPESLITPEVALDATAPENPRLTEETPHKPSLDRLIAGMDDDRLAFCTTVVYLLFFKITTLIQSDSIGIVVLTTVLSLPLLLLFTVAVARAIRTPQDLALHLGISAVLALPSMASILVARFPALADSVVLLSFLKSYADVMHLLPGLHGLLLIWFAVSIGVAVSRLAREMKMLLPMAVALACMDLYVVFGGGLVTQAETGRSTVARAAMKALTVNLPTTHPHGHAAPMQLAVGFADFLFIALFFACFARFGVPSRRTFAVLCGVLLLYMVVVAFTGLALPALVPIAVVVIGMNLRRFRYERSEVFALLYAGLILLAVLGGLVYLSRPSPAPKPAQTSRPAISAPSKKP